MDLASVNSNSSVLSDESHTSSLSAKLKRLKIEENLLFQSINKCVPDRPQIETEVDATSLATSYFTFPTEFKVFSAKTKNTYKDIRLKFQDIKTSTSSQEMLKSLDIDDVKKSTLELENNIKGFKCYLQSELAILKSAEKQLNESCNENTILMNKLKRRPRIQTAKYSEIVPSPVKTIMNSPFKCLEVQQFQEFMMNCGNRYGGWDEYHHNIFVNLWQKYFGSQNNTVESERVSVENSPKIHLFLSELLPKLQDISEEEVILHIKWYSKFMYLKDRQQKAIDKWRSNRKIMKSAKVEPVIKKDCIPKNRSDSRTTLYNLEIKNIVSDNLRSQYDTPIPDDSRGFVRKCLSDDFQYNSNVSKQLNSNLNITPKPKNFEDSCDSSDQTEMHFQKFTKQWGNGVNSKTVKTENLLNLENIKKLHVPTWREGL